MEFFDVLNTVTSNSVAAVSYLGKTTFDYVPDLYKQLAGNAMFESFFGVFVILFGVYLLYKLGKPLARFAIGFLSAFFRFAGSFIVALLVAKFALKAYEAEVNNEALMQYFGKVTSLLFK